MFLVVPITTSRSGTPSRSPVDGPSKTTQGAGPTERWWDMLSVASIQKGTHIRPNVRIFGHSKKPGLRHPVTVSVVIVANARRRIPVVLWGAVKLTMARYLR